MFNFIINFFNKNQNQKDHFCNIYNEQYRDSYNRLWIKQIQNYYP
jgi:hypothetical protein